MPIVIRLFAGAVLASLCGCTSSRLPAPQPDAVFFPPAPAQARLQYLTHFSAPSELEPPPAWLLRFVAGEQAPKRPIIKPYGMCLKQGTLRVCDTVIGLVHEIDLAQRTWRYFRPQGTGRIGKAINLDVDAQGRRYVADTKRGQVLIFDANGEYLTALGLEGEMKPADVKVSGRQVYVADLKSRQVLVFDAKSGKPIGRIPRDTEQDPDRLLFGPTNLALDDERLYVSDSNAFRVQVYDRSSGAFVRSYGKHGDFPGSFARNKGVAVDREGRVYVVDAAFQNVQVFNDKGLLTHFGDYAEQTRGALNLPASILIDYDHPGLFQAFVAPGYTLEYLVLVTSQYGPAKVNVYGFLQPE